MSEYGAESGYPFFTDIIAIAYDCPHCKAHDYKAPDADDQMLRQKAMADYNQIRSSLPIPDQGIPAGYNTNQILNHGYKKFRDLFNDRQLLCLGIFDKTIRKILRGKRFNNHIYNLLAKRLPNGRYGSIQVESEDTVRAYPVTDISLVDSVHPLLRCSDSRNLDFIPDESVDLVLSVAGYFEITKKRNGWWSELYRQKWEMKMKEKQKADLLLSSAFLIKIMFHRGRYHKSEAAYYHGHWVLYWPADQFFQRES